MNKLSVTALILGSGLVLAGSVLAGSDGHGNRQEGKGHRMAQLDTNKDGKVNLAELVQSKQAWLREVDSNKDGVATRAEIDAKHQARRAEHASKLLAEKDANKDGRIGRDESGMPPRWFARFDANSDGNLTREELSQHPGRRAGKGAEMDANSDGKVDAAEVKAAAERMLKRLDQNADGVLDASELQHKGRHRGPKGGEHGGKAPAATQPS